MKDRLKIGYTYTIENTVKLELTDDIVREVNAELFINFGATKIRRYDAQEMADIFIGRWSYPEDPESVQFQAESYIKDYLFTLASRDGTKYMCNRDDDRIFVENVDEDEDDDYEY